MKEFWNILNPDTWLKENIAATAEGTVVLPHSNDAKRFSLIGVLMHCYLKPEELWSPLFEDRRSLIFAAILQTPYLRHTVQHILKYSTLQKIPLQELNQRVDFRFIQNVIDVSKELRGA